MTQKNTIKTCFIDTSAFTKLYLDENGSKELLAFLGSSRIIKFTMYYCIGEFLGIIKAKLKRGEICNDKYLSISDNLMADLRNNQYQFEQSDITNFDIFNKVELLCKNHNNFDVVDSLQLITLKEGFLSALWDGKSKDSKPLFITADSELAKAARKEGLNVCECGKDKYPTILMF